MSMAFSDILREALALWQNPAFTELALEDQLAAGNRCLQQRWIDLDLSIDITPQLAVTEAFEFDDPESKQFTLSGEFESFSRMIRIETRPNTSTSEDDWQEETIKGFETWNDARYREERVVSYSFTGEEGRPVLYTSWEPTDTEFRIVYLQSIAEIVEVDTDLVLPSQFKALLVYDIALEFGELIDNLMPEFQVKYNRKMVYLLNRRQDALTRWDKWRRSQKGTGLRHRRAFNDRALAWPWNKGVLGVPIPGVGNDDGFIG